MDVTRISRNIAPNELDLSILSNVMKPDEFVMQNRDRLESMRSRYDGGSSAPSYSDMVSDKTTSLKRGQTAQEQRHSQLRANSKEGQDFSDNKLLSTGGF